MTNQELIQWPRAKWWDSDYNPIIGCRKISPACLNCWACEWAKRFHQSFEPHKSSKKNPPRKGVVFVGGLTDMFGEWNDSPLDHISKTARKANTDATYIYLTKRVERMSAVLSGIVMGKPFTDPDIFKNHYFGFTAENQEWYDRRFREACRFPWWANWWVSAEPLLGPIDLRLEPMLKGLGPICRPYLPYVVIVGCESGPNRRPCKIEWVESIVEQCRSANVPVFVKQICLPNGKFTNKIEEFPAHLQIRQVPWVKEGGAK